LCPCCHDVYSLTRWTIFPLALQDRRICEFE
jgi:hypothetical protein